MKYTLSVIVGIIIVAFIAFFYSTTAPMPHDMVKDVKDMVSSDNNKKNYPKYKEIVNPSGYVNTDHVTIGEHIGKKIVLLDIMTYSCINCIRTFPYLNQWYDSYKDDGLEIIGIHTPEFAFEHKKENVEKALGEYGITFPVVLDNDYSTWNAYGNRYWPRKYLIDLDGNVVYDHIGEGDYEETEAKIVELLEERAEKLGEQGSVEASGKTPEETAYNPQERRSPETYFGALRNKNFGSGRPGATGTKTFSVPEDATFHTLYLNGDWNIQPEYAESQDNDVRIVFNYSARNVFLVMEADEATKITVLRDGEVISEDIAGEDISNGSATIQTSRLYSLIEDPEYGEHSLEIIIHSPGLRAFAFTFG